MRNSEKTIYISHLLVLIAASSAVIWPGLSGPFFLDDFLNLAPFMREGINYHDAIFNNNAGPFGRVVTMTSFALNYWVGGELITGELKLTNLVIHTGNGLLLYALMNQLLSRYYSRTEALTLALFISLLWLINPVNTGVTLYVIQRATLLTTTFMLSGLLTYTFFRSKISQSRPLAFYYLSVIIIFWIFALLSKENAILFPLFIIVIELCFYRDTFLHRILSNNRLTVLLGIGIILSFIPGLSILKNLGYLNYTYRSFNLSERIFTQPKAIFKYVQETVLPNKLDIGLYRDDFIISSSLWDKSTIFSLLLIIFLLSVAVYLIKQDKAKYVAAGILLFFSGHLLESTIFPLEIFFLHRNYFPSIGLFIALVPTAAYVIRLSGLRKILIVAVPCLYTLLLMQHSYRQSLVYASDEKITINAYSNHPDSLRINLKLAGRLVQQGDLDASLAINQRFILQNPRTSLPARIQRLYIYCELATALPPQEYMLFKDHINLSNPRLLSTALYNLTDSRESNTCDFINFETIYTDLGNWIDQQLSTGKWSAEYLWELDYFVIDYFYSVGESQIAEQRLNRHLTLDNPKARRYQEYRAANQ